MTDETLRMMMARWEEGVFFETCHSLYLLGLDDYRCFLFLPLLLLYIL